ncbi:glycosyltransferase family 2 protein [Anianabacter salinae]|uniref:glycosyltransferase family 2 protein n=1 Tax=Anianabacter salinae TaxID=2851023 RepID=UPI00225E651D|nr:glycosyltransferase family 2 protein [Anianabacter salinae]MBV0913574.1 glycosyltransferase family 2 protein [Anianabacter salinae]
MTRIVSVVVVSRDRPRLLLRTLLGLSQLDHTAFEVVLVADAAGRAAIDASPFAGRVKLAAFDQANISAARNLGIAQAAGEVIAFIDDDSVPEPTWLSRLTAPFDAAEVSAATGYVRGRNGISFQSRCARVDALGWDHPVPMPGDAVQVLDTRPGDAVKTVGTNCAFRSDVLRRHGGFDPAIRFFLDETELDLRLAWTGARIAVVPGAEVHHGFAASGRRTAARRPTTLHEEAASVAILLRKHAPEADMAAQFRLRRQAQERRLARHLVQGTAEPRHYSDVLTSFDAGWADGMARPLHSLAPLPEPQAGFLRFKTAPGETRVLAGRPGNVARLRQEAERHVAEGGRASLFLFGRTGLYHRVRFTHAGVWEQSGGQFGRSDRNMPIFQAVTYDRRLTAEIARLSARNLPEY